MLHLRPLLTPICAAILASGVTYHRDVAPILRAHCASCHRAGTAAPFPFDDYADARKRARQIAAVTGRRFMPPWLAEPGFGDLSGARRLTGSEIETLARWAAAGAPEGEPATPRATPPSPTTPASGWTLGPPDLVLATGAPLPVPAEGLDLMHTFVLPGPRDAARLVEAIELRTSAPAVVKHAMLLADTTGFARETDALTPEPGFDMAASVGFDLAGSFGSWNRGATAMTLPAGFGMTLPAGADLCLELHLEPIGKPALVTAEIGLHFAATPGARPVATVTMGSLCIDIPPGERSYVVRDLFVAPVDLTLFALTPRAGYVCREIRVVAELPDDAFEPLLLIRRWDPNWRERYRFESPVCLPAGARIEMRYVYDNSAENPQNPSHPPRRVTLGHGVRDEMAFLQLHVAPDDPDDLPRVNRANEEQGEERTRRYRAWRASRP